jgi:RHS repeat-associated protein
MLLGVYDLTPASNPKVELTDNANEVVVADAVRAVLHTTAELGYVVDNGDTGTGETGGGWWNVGVFNTDRGTYHGQEARGANDGTYTWPLDPPAAGRYRVYARWLSLSSNTSGATYTVTHAGGTADVVYDHKVNGGIWASLGLYDLTPSSGHKVVLSKAATGDMIADAIKVVPIEIGSLAVAADAVKFVANDAEELLYVHTDHLGSPRKITDAGRGIVWDAVFTPFGEEDSIAGSETANWRFPGQYHDAEAGLSYNYRRTYDPALGRYLQSDPIGLEGGLNTYAYSLQNPVKFIDPRGLVVTMTCRYLGRGMAVLGLLGYKHCAVIVWHWEKDECGLGKKVIDAQYSLAFGGTSPSNPDNPTYKSDTEAFLNGNENYEVSPPLGMSEEQFDQAVMAKGNSYTQGPYNALTGPNSNTMPDNIIEGAGGVAPDVPGAWMQNHGDIDERGNRID